MSYGDASETTNYEPVWTMRDPGPADTTRDDWPTRAELEDTDD